MIVSVQSVRDILGLAGSNSRYPDGLIGSNIRASQAFLEKRTGRVFEATNATRKFTTEGKAYLTIPGLATASAVTLNSSPLTEDSTYWLIPDAKQTGVYTGIQFRAFESRPSGVPWWMGNPEWFDRGLDLPPYYGSHRGSQPNDLSITGSWGYAAFDGVLEEIPRTVAILAAWMTKRGDALFAGGVATPEGQLFDLSTLPVEVQAFIAEWKLQGGGVEGVG